ncbi:hypothetical protein [Wolbachia endosymbiont of Ctenocephalides felis wCfeT]|uniref:hypothetical protein n=1 Tax=Wolbachia endosymbiont of Ctenocephalides felis wCfeT TaxID=2732593 RepID=UPI0014472BBC|nr:hypothetical protein [Wolbachia endosymbiont of Ctenocephalides felis wCfeT]
MDERRKIINGPAKEFIYGELDSIKFSGEIRNEQGGIDKVDLTLHDFSCKAGIHWRNSSLTTCDIEKQDHPRNSQIPPGTKINFENEHLNKVLEKVNRQPTRSAG